MSSNKTSSRIDLPLMVDNVIEQDLQKVQRFLSKKPILTQSKQVRAFEEEWSQWLGVKHSVFVNSGSSANLLTLAALKILKGTGQVIVPTLTWVSDITSVLVHGFEPVFVDIDPRTLGMSTEAILKKITKKTKAVFITHILGYNALTAKLLNELRTRGILLLEDVCESHGATFRGQKLGTFGWASNFSFYYAHHLTTIEGGMISTNDPEMYEVLRMLRSHGMVRESTSETIRRQYTVDHPDLNPSFIFAFAGYNVRSTEINAVFGLNQLKRLDRDIQKRNANLKLFLSLLDDSKYRTDFELEGCSNYAFTLILQEKDEVFRNRVERALQESGVEFRRGLSGGGNQLRQPYLKKAIGAIDPRAYPEVEHVHFFGWYIGNFPLLQKDKIKKLCHLLNNL